MVPYGSSRPSLLLAPWLTFYHPSTAPAQLQGSFPSAEHPHSTRQVSQAIRPPHHLLRRGPLQDPSMPHERLLPPRCQGHARWHLPLSQGERREFKARKPSPNFELTWSLLVADSTRPPELGPLHEGTDSELCHLSRGHRDDEAVHEGLDGDRAGLAARIGAPFLLVQGEALVE